MTFAKRIKSARLMANLSQEKLARAISNFENNQTITRTAIAQWESGATKELTATNLLKVARVLKTNPEWLCFGTGIRKLDDIQRANLLVDSAIKILPLLNPQQAIDYLDYMKSSNPDPPMTGLDLAFAAATSDHIFAIKIYDQSMLPEFNIGDIVVIDPNIKPQPGEIVLALVKDNNGVSLRKYQPLSKNADGFDIFDLVPLNGDWPTITVDSHDSAKIMGTLVEHRCRRRLTSSVL